MDKPIYGRQLIRFAETVPSGQVGTAEIPAHRVVGFDLDAAGDPLILQGEAVGANFVPLGVNQFTIPAAADEGPAVGPRNASVATSGLLLVEIVDVSVDNNPPVAGQALAVNAAGRARAIAGTENTNYFLVTVNGTVPTVREVYGDFAIVSFS